MIITKKHYKLMERILEKWSEGLTLERLLDELTSEELEYLTHLELAGLVREQADGFEFTQAGHLVTEALKECYENIVGEDDNFRVLGSEIISLIEVARTAQGDVQAQPEVARLLERRGLAQNGKLLPIAESILKAYEIAQPEIYISPGLSEKIRKMAPGPGKKSLLNFTRHETFRMEAMRLLTFSLPEGNIYSFTGAGQQIRAGLLKGAVVDFPLTGELLAALLEPTPKTKWHDQLMLLGAYDQQGNLSPAGKHLKIAAQFLFRSPITINPAIDIEEDDFLVLRLIDELWQKHQQHPEIYPSYKQLKEQLTSIGRHQLNPTYGLFLLESFNLIATRQWDKKELVYELTEWGKEILTDRIEQASKPIFATSVMAITTTRMENLSPDDHWVKMAEEQKLIGAGFPGKSGRLFSKLAGSIERWPVISSLESRVLRVLPLWRGMFEQTILDFFPANEREQVLYALRKLIAHALIDALPGNLYKLTEAGERFKRATGVVPPGIEFHVTPHILRLLQAAKHMQKNGKIDWHGVEREVELAPEIFQNTLFHAKKLHYIKSDKMTTSGELLLEGLDLLHQVKTIWEEIEI